MNKILRISMIAVLALIANFSFGQAYKTLTFPDDNKATNGISTSVRDNRVFYTI